ncbi:hypothetical protein XA68_10053 [Ophiocordyceps unilateralis]|uniref:JmjC domain-containing protein n=1 Tax=Ophiocordyceps unilateralis TaxID=268505 RepID=A0A2A9PVG8_OPHUN|nr:hypothetical protein XA68_10053 [Ophiocordyceps unilateralis]
MKDDDDAACVEGGRRAVTECRLASFDDDAPSVFRPASVTLPALAPVPPIDALPLPTVSPSRQLVPSVICAAPTLLPLAASTSDSAAQLPRPLSPRRQVDTPGSSPCPQLTSSTSSSRLPSLGPEADVAVTASPRPSVANLPDGPAPLHDDALTDVEHGYDDVQGDRILHLRPTSSQWQDFPAILAYARSLGVERDGCFKVSIPDSLRDPLPEKPANRVPANAYKIKQIKKTTFWQVSTVPSDGEFGSSTVGSDFSESVSQALKNLKRLFRSNKDRQMRSVRYRVDVPAWTARQRRDAGVPERSPIHPLKGDKLDHTKAIIPGIHTPYVYESGPYFGATFQIHAEDFRLASLNHLYKGRKIWIVVPATAVDVAEAALGREQGCSQFMRHRAEFFFPDKLDKLGIPYRLVDQRPGETMVILPDAYHEGFSTGYTIAEARNYADGGWNTDSYQPCEESCRLATAIPAALMRPLADGEDRLDLCAAYGDDGRFVVPSLETLPSAKRSLDDQCDDVLASGQSQPQAAESGLEERDAKRVKV